ncbi:MAG: hypothetical protein ACRDRJ_25390 [Streptosporangiaceae bacterium]
MPHAVEHHQRGARDGGGRGPAAADVARACRSAWPAARSPVVDVIEVSDRTRPGYSIATVWAIIPPSDAPTR